MWLISHYELKQESTTAIRRIVDHILKTEKDNFESGNHVVAPDVLFLGKLVNDIWGEKVTIKWRGSRGHVERHYLHLARKEVGLEKTELPKNWTYIFKMDKKTCFVRLENFLCGGSNEYELADFCKYLEVSPEMWFGEWSENHREEYIKKF